MIGITLTSTRNGGQGPLAQRASGTDGAAASPIASRDFITDHRVRRFSGNVVRANVLVPLTRPCHGTAARRPLCAIAADRARVTAYVRNGARLCPTLEPNRALPPTPANHALARKFLRWPAAKSPRYAVSGCRARARWPSAKPPSHAGFSACRPSAKVPLCASSSG
jgi:hypothetical protein